MENVYVSRRNEHLSSGQDLTRLLFWDPYTGERRGGVKDDVVKSARVVDYLPEIDFCMCFAIAGDVNEMASDVHHFEAMLLNSEKASRSSQAGTLGA